MLKDKNLKKLVLGAALGGLAACGGSGTSNEIAADMRPAPDETITLAPFLTSSGGSAVGVQYDSAQGEYRVRLDGTTTVLDQRSFTFDSRQVKSGTNQSQTELVYHSDSRDRQASLYSPDVNGGQPVYYTLARNSETERPTSGTARMVGGYVGFAQEDSYTAPLSFLITGDATVDVNFDQSTLRGTVTDRTAHTVSDHALLPIGLDNLSLAATSIDDNGVFSGATLGGSWTLPIQGTPPAVVSQFGEYTGLLTGDNATGVAVGIKTEQVLDDGSILIETGIIGADEVL